MSKVPVQKGEINSNPRTMKQMTHKERVAERAKELKDLRRCQTLDYYSPSRKK
jgi:hypothetical protein